MKRLLNVFKREKVTRDDLKHLLDDLRDESITDREIINRVIRTAAKVYKIPRNTEDVITAINRELYFDNINYTLIYREYWKHDSTLKVIETL